MFAMSNNCPDFLMFETPSRSRPSVSHTVAVCKRTGHVGCTCEDSLYRKRGGDLLDKLCPFGCWHVRQFAATIAPVISQALGVKP